MSSKRARAPWGLRGKLITAMLGVGAVPLVIGMGMAWLQGTRELHEMAGTNFSSLAGEAARTVDLVFGDELTRMARIARSPMVIDILQARARAHHNQDEQALAAGESRNQDRWSVGDPGLVTSITTGTVAEFLKQQVTQPEGDAGQIRPAASRAATRALYVTDARGLVVASTTQDIPYVHRQESWWQGAYDNGVGQPYIGNVYFDSVLGVYAFQVAVPIMDQIRYRAVGVLHRVVDAREYLAPALFPIRFGKTGHVMLLDSDGIVMACPILPTGITLSDMSLVPTVTGMSPGWVKASSDGHGGEATSIIGFSPLPGTSEVTRTSTDTTWHTFVWQASEELSAPTRHFFMWLLGFGMVSMGLLSILGYVASGQIVTPIRRLQMAASLIAKGELNEPIRVESGDELEQLADEMNRMNRQLQEAFTGLTDTVEKKSREVRTLQALNQQILESVPHPIMLLDEEGHVDYLNRAACEAFPGGASQNGGRSLHDILGGDDRVRQRLDVELGIRRNGGPLQGASGEEELRDPLTPVTMAVGNARSELQIHDRSYQYQWFRIGPPSSEPHRLGLIFRDVTEERRLQEQVIESEKSSGLSLMASGIGHELNNPLFSIVGLSEAMVDEPDVDVMRDHAQHILSQAKRMAAVIQELTGQVLRQVEPREPVDCNEILSELLGRLRTMDAAAGVEIRPQLGAIPPVQGGAADIRQVLMNVLINAVQAMQGHGVLECRTEASRGKVIVTVRDSGTGIPRSFLPRVFDPFFTTKAQGEGRGLGLTVARRIIEGRGGRIRIESKEGQGTSVVVTLPALDASECGRRR